MVFLSQYLLLADNLAVNLLQLILTYSEYGFISVDQDDPLRYGFSNYAVFQLAYQILNLVEVALMCISSHKHA